MRLVNEKGCIEHFFFLNVKENIQSLRQYISSIAVRKCLTLVVQIIIRLSVYHIKFLTLEQLTE